MMISMFLKTSNRSNCCEFRAIKLNSSLYRDKFSRTFVIEFGKILGFYRISNF